MLEESVYSFLRQDYPGPKQLLILNDFALQTIVFEHPEVTVVNVGERFATLGEKRNEAVRLCRYDLIAVWDDDDIYLPHRLSLSVAKYDPHRRFFKMSRAFVMDNGCIQISRISRYHAAGIWHRGLFEEAGGYPAMGSGEDAHLEGRFQQIIGGSLSYSVDDPREIYYVYRWKGSGSFHISGYGRDGEGRSGHDRVLEFVMREVEAGRVTPGSIVLQPQWTHDYPRMVRDYIATISGT
jgi:hypothetical protein